jgi:RNA polymerase sigma factor (sigma-70 family)
MLMGICRRYCRGEEVAKDALQDSFVNIFSYIHSIKDVNTAEAWMRKIAVNSCIALYRKKMMPVYTAIDESLELANAELPIVFDKLQEEELLELIESLPDNLRLVFNLFVIDGYNHKDIGGILNIGESSSRAYLVRARRILIEIIQKKYQDEYASFVERRTGAI